MTAPRRPDPLRERTERLLADYLEHCAREPGSPGRPPSTPEAALLRAVAAEIRQQYPGFFSRFRGYRGNRVELMGRMAEAVLSDDAGLTWSRVATLLAFAGTLLQREEARGEPRPGGAARDCRCLVRLLSSWLLGRHRAWLEDHGGWDGFCLYFRAPLPLAFWRSLLLQILVTCVFTMTFICLWTQFYHKSRKL